MKKKELYPVIRKIKAKSIKDKFFRVNRDFIQDFFLNDEKILQADIYFHRIFAHIVANLSAQQTHPKNEDNEYQLRLFDEEYRSINNSSLVFEMNISDIYKDSRYDRLQKTLDFLELYKRDWYKSINHRGETITMSGGLIANPVINQNTGNFQFSITAHWLSKILHLTHYNDTYYNLVQNISSQKQMLFWYWLICLRQEGTEINYTTLNKKFNLNYSSARSLKKGFLTPIRKKYDQYAHISFNPTVKGDKITIIPYNREINSFIKEYDVSDKTEKNLKKAYKIGYISRRHKIDDFYTTQLRLMIEYQPSLINRAYNYFVRCCRKNKKKTTDYKNSEFIRAFQASIINVYQKSSSGQINPKAYPKFEIHPINPDI